MKHSIAAAALTLIFASIAFSQASANRGLILTGSVVGVRPNYDSESKNIDYLSPKPDDFVFDVQLYLQFSNESDSPIIIFVPGNFLGQKKTVFLEQFFFQSNTQEAVPMWTSRPPQFYDPFRFFLQKLKAPEPPKNLVTIIPPRGYYECGQTLSVRNGYKLVRKPHQRLAEMRANPMFPALRLEYHLSLRDQSEDTNALEEAKLRWKTFGELPLDANGDYSVKSEIILNKLAD